MHGKLLEVIYSEFGTPSRTEIVVNGSAVEISGHGGRNREEFSRTEKTPSSLWDQLIMEVGKFKPGELQGLSRKGKRNHSGLFGVTIKTTEAEERSVFVKDEKPPEKLQGLLDAIFSAQSPLDEVVYSENGMSQRLKLNVRRDKTWIEKEGGPGGRLQTDTVTPTDFWESLCLAIKEIEVENVPEMLPPSNRRAADISLYASLQVRYNGEWYVSQDFDDDNPPEPLHNPVRLIKLARWGAFREYGRKEP